METKQIAKTSKELVNEADSLLSAGYKLLDPAGNTLELSTEWLTVKSYCERFGIENMATVTNWIRRGKIPPENIRVIQDLNGLRLIKAVPVEA